jgi:hypothetical protein
MLRLITKNITIAILVLAAQLSGSSGASRVNVLPIDSLQSIVFFGPMHAKLTYIEPKLRDMQFLASPSVAMREAVANDSNLMAKLFKPKWPELQGIAPLVEDGKDVLMAIWKSHKSSAGFRSVTVWDEPEFNLFLFEVDSAVLDTPDAVRNLWQELFQLAAPPLNISAIDFRMLSTKNSTGTVGMGWVAHQRNPRRADAKGYALFLGDYRTSLKAYLCVWVGKKLVPGIFDPDTAFVPERFPPLSERLKSMSTSTLLREFRNAPERDSIVTDEILSRKLNEEEFNQIFDAPPDGEQARAYIVFGEIARLNRTQPLQKEIKSLFSKYVQQGESRSGVISAILQSLRGTSQIDFSEEALRLLSQNVAVKACISYLEFRGNTTEIADKLLAMPVSKPFERQKKIAVREILKRAGAWDRIQ